jgi:uncharacterized protein (DUF3084 family)
MRYSILFVLALILVSGFIAYFGDILGRRMGKKRLTLFNLRPRYTAIVVTTITGMIISALAVIALISVNSQFRKVLTEGERIFTQNKRLSTQNTALARSNRMLAHLRQELQRRVDEQKKALEAAGKEVEKARLKKDAAEKSVQRLATDIAARKSDIAGLRNQIDLLRARKLEVDDDLDAVQAELAKAQTDLQKRQVQLTAVQTNYATAAANLGKARQDLSDAQGKLTETQGKLLDVQSKLMATSGKLLAKERELASETTKRIQAEALTSQFWTGDLVLRQGDEIARGVISPAQTPFGVWADLMSLLERVGESAAIRGAGVGNNDHAVNLVFRSPDGSVSDRMTERECLEVARASIVRSRGDVLVQVVCARNTVAGEQAPVEFVLYPNGLVFKKGEAVAATKLEGRASEGRVLLAVIALLQGPVADAAVAKGVVPVANYDPRQNMGINPQKQLDALLNVVDQIRSKKAKVDVTVYACADVYAAGPINMDNLRFSVTKVE